MLLCVCIKHQALSRDGYLGYANNYVHQMSVGAILEFRAKSDLVPETVFVVSRDNVRAQIVLIAIS